MWLSARQWPILAWRNEAGKGRGHVLVSRVLAVAQGANIGCVAEIVMKTVGRWLGQGGYAYVQR